MFWILWDYSLFGNFLAFFGMIRIFKISEIFFGLDFGFLGCFWITDFILIRIKFFFHT